MSATSSDELHSAAWGGGELRDSPSRKSSAQFAAPILSGSGCGVRPGHRRCPAASPATLRVARARPLCYEVRPQRAPLAPLKRRPRRGRRFSESRYSLSAYSSSPPAVSSNELRRVAVRRAGWRRTARPVGSQEQHLLHHPNPSVSACRPSPRAAKPLGDKAGGLKVARATPHSQPKYVELVLGLKHSQQVQPKALPNSLPRVRPIAAPLALRRSFARLGKSCQNVPAHFDDFPPKAWRANALQEGTALRPGRPRVPAAGKWQPLPKQLTAASPRFSIPRRPRKPPYRRVVESAATGATEGAAGDSEAPDAERR